METKKLIQQILAGADRLQAKAAQIRHKLHQSPELTWSEVETSKSIEAYLRSIDGIRVTSGVATYGVVGLIEGAHPGPVVALRADMDALPIEERTDLDYASKNKGVMHACGHDGHMANLLAAAELISELREHLRGSVKFIFQPAEEGGAGGLKMCEAGVLENPKVDVIFGMHGWPEAECGKVWVKSGTLMASNTEVHVKVKGKGCHAAMPHLGTDQLLVAARMIDSLQSFASRVVAPSDSIALSITQIQAGTATNIIPSEVSFAGTLRTVSKQTRQRLIEQIPIHLNAIASAHGVECEVELKAVYPETVNHKEPTLYLESTLKELLGDEIVDIIEHPTMGAEDFSYYLQRVPGCFFFLGTSDGRREGYPPLHHPCYDFNDKALRNGIASFVCLAMLYADQCSY